MKLDIVGAVGSCYASIGDEDAWLTGLLEPLAPLDHGPGQYAQTFHISPQGAFKALRVAVRGGFSREAVAEVETLNNLLPPHLLSRVYAPGVRYAIRDHPTLRELGGDLFARSAIEDALRVVAREPGGAGVEISIPIARGRRHAAPRSVQQLVLYSAHLASALRLRRSVHSLASLEAVTAPDPGGGAVEPPADAGRAADQSLATAAVGRLEGGSLCRATDAEALVLWKALLEGTWSVVDHCEIGGNRFLLARRNEPGVRDPAALTRREAAVLAFAARGDQDKLIGYALGIAPSGVSRYLASARRKLGLASRAELIDRFAGTASNS